MDPTEYTDQSQFVATIGEQQARLVAPDASGKNVDSVKVSETARQVNTEIDDALRSRYTLPLPVVPEYLQRAAARILHHELCDESQITDLIRDRAREARATIRQLSTGALQLAPDTGQGNGASRTDSGRATLTLPAGKRQFRRDQTRGLV